MSRRKAEKPAPTIVERGFPKVRDGAGERRAPFSHQDTFCASPVLVIEHFVTADDELGPAPPLDDGNWHAVRGSYGHTTWRRICIKT